MPAPPQKIQIEFHQLKNILIKRFGQEYAVITLTSRIDFAPACELSFILREISMQESRLSLFGSFYLKQHSLERSLHQSEVFLNQLYDYQDLLDVIRYLCIMLDEESQFDKQTWFRMKQSKLDACFSQMEVLYLRRLNKLKCDLNAFPDSLSRPEFSYLISLVKEHMAWYTSKLIIHRLLTWLCAER